MNNHRKNKLVLISILLAIFIWMMVIIGNTPNDVGQVYIHDYNIQPKVEIRIVEQTKIEVEVVEPIIEEEVVVAKREQIVAPTRSVDKPRRLIGSFEFTAYCPCVKCCGANAKGITASGTKVKEGRTIAVDTSVIPMGTKVYIDGIGERIAEDRGGAIKGNKIDLFFNSHQDALNFGRQKNIKVYLIGGDNY